MLIQGQLKDDIAHGKVALFLGAGASQAAGLPGASSLAEWLFNEAGAPEKYVQWKHDLQRLVARLDNDLYFTRQWTNRKLTEYFIERSNYATLDSHKLMFKLNLAAIFTTNFDLCMEFAEHENEGRQWRLLPIVDPNEMASIYGKSAGRIRYFKIHGCCKEIEQHPRAAPPLVITQADFRLSIRRNALFLEELKRCAYDNSIVFLGFQVHRSENNQILASVIDTYSNLSTAFHQPFKAFAVLTGVNSEDRADIEDAGLNLLEGTFEEFLENVAAIQGDVATVCRPRSYEQKIWIKVQKKEIGLTASEYDQYTDQFTPYHETYLEDQSASVNSYPSEKLRDMWKARPSDSALAKGFYIKRGFFGNVVGKIEEQIQKVIRGKSARILVIHGKRACGKSVLSRQLLSYCYLQLHQPALHLTQEANYFDIERGSTGPMNISGWDGRLLDKFLSLFSPDEDGDRERIVPVILADHLSHRLRSLDPMLRYLENHGKPSLLILVLNDDEFEEMRSAASLERLLHLYGTTSVFVAHKVKDGEIEDLFDVVSCLEPRVLQHKDLLIRRARERTQCDRDILLILYTWFDGRFRRLEEIIADEIDKLNHQEQLKNFYLEVALFHRYNLSPRLSVCAEAAGLSIEDFVQLRSEASFKALIETDCPPHEPDREMGMTRHSEFSRRVVEQLVPDVDQQVDLMARVLNRCTKKDLVFVRDFFGYILHYHASFTLAQATHLKEATETVGRVEHVLKKDSVLNHQFGAYLIREEARLEDARYYLDLALLEDPDNTSIIHSIGNLCFKLYKQMLGVDDEKALEFYDAAKDYFGRTRVLKNYEEEHGYYTEIDMIRFRMQSISEVATKAMLYAEQQALTFEALRVIPPGRQNLIRDWLGRQVPFGRLSPDFQEAVREHILSGTASPLLMGYYAMDLLGVRSESNWVDLARLVSLYADLAQRDAATAVVVSLIAKRSFLWNAETRFELLRGFYDRLVRYRELQINFVALAEFARLIHMDAFVLGKYDYLRSIIPDTIEIFRDSKPRFLKDEYIFQDRYYRFDESDHATLKQFFVNEKIDFSLSAGAKRFEARVNLDRESEQKFFNIELDPVSHYYIKGLRKETAARGRSVLNFCIKHTTDGFLAAHFSA